MIKLESIGISVDLGVIPPVSRTSFRVSNIGISVDKGVIQPKNYFKSKISSIGISLGEADQSILFYQVN